MVWGVGRVEGEEHKNRGWSGGWEGWKERNIKTEDGLGGGKGGRRGT